MTKSERDKLIDELEREPEKPKEAIGFKPSMRCPVCRGRHEIKYEYRGKPLLMCPKMEIGKIYFTDAEDPDYCGLGGIVSGPNDPFWQESCKPHDEAYDEMKLSGNAKVGLLGTSARWVENTSKVFIRSLWGVIGFPFYLIGGLVGGAVRWKQVFPKETIKRDDESGDMH